MTDSGPSTRSDYKDSLLLPRTDFPIRARLPDSEPTWLAHWDRIDLYGRLRLQAKGRKRFVLHDGPPYANGHIHAGTALNKILKDMIVRYRQMTGLDADYVPGWDCHGLPIEWQVEEQFRKQGRSRREVDTAQFRRACREHASHWIDVQKAEFKRLGVTGSWDAPYLTMEPRSEAAIVREFLRLAHSGQIRKGARPVMWSPVEQTALAEAEIEYAERSVSTIWVRFPLIRPLDGLSAAVVIWTTTPWTIPANQAVIHNPSLRYGLYRVRAPDCEEPEHIIASDGRLEAIAQDARVTEISRIRDVDPSHLGSLVHPLAAMDRAVFGHEIPLLAGSNVTDDAGTGFVHAAPAHGEDDYRVWMEHRPTERIVDMIDDHGRYRDDAVPQELAGLEIITLGGKKRGRDGPANRAVMSALRAQGALLAVQKTVIRDAHSWRSKAPVIRRLTSQWFVPMDTPIHDNGPGLRDAALEQIASVGFTPERGRERLAAMVRDRPDWLISRQRLWGTPMALFVHRSTGHILNDEHVDARILDAIERDGADVWFSTDPSTFLGPEYSADDYEQVTDILDVWFDSGCTHAFVLEPRGSWPADLYLEGSDQHRGWFQSSLLHGCATRHRAPYRSVLTHGFVVDASGHKMSKSKGNTVSPMRIASERGADILRLWVAGCDYTDDPSIGEEALSASADAYRKLRNTLRYLLGALPEGDTLTAAPPSLAALERYVLHRLAEVDTEVRDACDANRFRRAFTAIMRLAVQDLSAFYFDVRKDCLYCDPLSSERRAGCLYVLSQVFDYLSAWLAPVLVFTCEEAWHCRYPGSGGSVHLRQFPDSPEAWLDARLAARWERILTVRKVVNAALEKARQSKQIGSSLDATVRVHIADSELCEAFCDQDAADIFITSGADLISGDSPASAFTVEDIPGVGVSVARALGVRCARSWKHFDPATADPEFPDISARDARAVRDWMARRQPR